jgi:heme exporter protein A
LLIANATTGSKGGQTAACRVLPSRIVNRATPDTAPDSSPPDPTGPRLVAEQLRCAPSRLDCEIDLRLGPGEALQIEGPNGSGKTSLLRVLCGLVQPDAGRICWDGTDIAEDPGRFHQDLSFIGHAAGIKRDLTARENLEATHAIAGGPARVDHADALARVGLARHADVPLRRLSAGQARRVTLARLLTERSALWILDEPFTALDTDAKRMLEGFIVAHCEAGGMALVTTHQPADFGALPVRLLALGGHGAAA